MNIEKIREEFEAWASSPEFGLRSGHFARGEDGEYLNYPTQCYFMVWQASRAAIEVDVPRYSSDAAGDWHPDNDGDSVHYPELERAIESLGLKVKA